MIQPIDPALFDGPTLYLGITIDGEELLPRQPVGGSAYALLASKSLDAERLGGQEVEDFVTEQELNEQDIFLTEESVGRASLTNNYGDLNNLPDLSAYVTGDELPDWDLFLTEDEVGTACLTNEYGDLSGLPDLSEFVTEDELPEGLSSIFESAVAARDVPIDIPRGVLQGISSELETEFEGTIKSVAVTVSITHPDVSDLTITLNTPYDTTILLHNGEPGGENLQITYPIERDTAEGHFDDLIGNTISGVWRLDVVDTRLGVEGDRVLESWSIQLEREVEGTSRLQGNLVIDGAIIAENSNLLFGGDGSEGPLIVDEGIVEITSGIHNYSSITIEEGAILTISEPANEVLYLRSKGDCIISGKIDLKGKGALGGAGRTATAERTNSGENGVSGIQDFDFLDHYGGRGLPSSESYYCGGGGGGGIFPGGNGGNEERCRNGGEQWHQYESQITESYIALTKGYFWGVGSGGGGGVKNNRGATTSGTGGNGGGAIVIECAGRLTFTSEIDVSGKDGGDGQLSGSSSGHIGGGGGGAGGTVLILYNELIELSGSIVVEGGAGGQRVGNNAYNGGVGSRGIYQLIKNKHYFP